MEPINNDLVIKAMTNSFVQDFSVMSGCMALFVIANKTDDPMATIEKVIDFFASQKKPLVKEVIEKSMEVRANPENFGDYDNLIFGSIEPEDYQISFQKAILGTKKEIIEMFKEFNEKHGN